MRRLLGSVFAGVATVSALLILSAGQARASTVQCGDTITQDTTLDSDLIDCPGYGIVIGADNITLDLNGYTITGSASAEAGVYGIGRRGITIENGSISWLWAHDD